MRELRLENTLIATQERIYYWIKLLEQTKEVPSNILEWMAQQANRIQIQLEIK